MMAGECSAAFERLPCLQDVDILRNILYGGIWGKYRKMQVEKAKNREEETDNTGSTDAESENTEVGMENTETMRQGNTETGAMEKRGDKRCGKI